MRRAALALPIVFGSGLYAAGTYGGRTQKYRLKPGADRSEVICCPVVLMSKSTQ